MNAYIDQQTGKVIVIHLDRGDLLLESVETILGEYGIRNAILTSCIGTLNEVSMHFNSSTSAMPNDEFMQMQGAYEIGSMSGMVLDGRAHFHFVISNGGQGSIAGHVENGCVVQNLAEISLIELPNVDLVRKKNEFGVNSIATRCE